MSANEPTPPIGDKLSELWANADNRGIGLADTLRLGREEYLRGEAPVEDWQNTVGGCMARGRWMRTQLEREATGLPVEEFDLETGLDEVERDLARLEREERLERQTANSEKR